MFQIGEFSKITKTTVKTLRYYDEVGLLKPAFVDEWTNFRYYTTEQLYPLQKIVSLRQAGLSIEEIKQIMSGNHVTEILESRKAKLESDKQEIEEKLLRMKLLIQNVREDTKMKYQAIVKQIPGYTVYYKQGIIRDFSQMTDFVLSAGAECKKANPTLTCIEPDYCYVSYLDEEFKPENMMIEYAQAVTEKGIETDNIHFKTLSPIEAVCVYHKGSYDGLQEAYAFALNWAKENGYSVSQPPREQYIDGIWNKDNEADWLTEVQIPVVESDEASS